MNQVYLLGSRYKAMQDSHHREKYNKEGKMEKSKWLLRGAGKIIVHPYIIHTIVGVLLSFERWKKTESKLWENNFSLLMGKEKTSIHPKLSRGSWEFRLILFPLPPGSSPQWILALFPVLPPISLTSHLFSVYYAQTYHKTPFSLMSTNNIHTTS